MHHITSHHINRHAQQTPYFTLGKPFMGENPNNLSYEDSLIIRTSIHHDNIHQTLAHMRVYINKETKYLSFHVGLVIAASTLTLSIVRYIEELSSSSRINQYHHAISVSHIIGLNTKPQRLSLSITQNHPQAHISRAYTWRYIQTPSENQGIRQILSHDET